MTTTNTDLFPPHSLWVLPSGNVVRIIAFALGKGVQVGYPDDGKAWFNPQWLYRVGKRLDARSGFKKVTP